MTRGAASSTMHPTHILRVATYNIHKGVRGIGPRKRLEIHNIGLGVEALDADLICLQEVRNFNHGEAARFPDTHFGWPRVPQANHLAPEGYDVAYRTNATTHDGEHGNALDLPHPARVHQPEVGDDGVHRGAVPVGQHMQQAALLETVV